MTRIHRLSAVAATLALVAASGCDAAPQVTGPAADIAGRLSVTFQGEPAGAVLMTVRGPGIGEPRVIGAGREMFARSLDSTGTAYRLAIVGDRVYGELFSFVVPDTRHPELYTVSLIQVADPGDRLLESVDGYTLAVTATGGDVQ